jgi:hypothetical protein
MYASCQQAICGNASGRHRRHANGRGSSFLMEIFLYIS